MDELNFRILDALASSLGNNTSISSLKERVKERSGKATYKNIYEKTQELARNKILNLEIAGKASLVSLNLENPATFDLLSEMEFAKKRKFLEKNPEMQAFLFAMESTFSRGFYFIESISIMRPARNAKLNKAEFLFLLREPLLTETEKQWDSKEEGEKAIQNEIELIYSTMQLLQKRHNLKADFLVLRENEFFELLKEQGKNALKEMLSDKTAFYSPQAFWLSIRRAMDQGITVKAESEEFKPAKASEKELFYNLSRFGYTEFGEKLQSSENIAIESIAMAILLQGDARRKEAIPVIISKAFDNKAGRKPNYRLLAFMCARYGKLPELLGLLEAFNKIKPLKETEKAIKLIKKSGIEGKKVDLNALKEKMRLYNVI
ncbi:MAG: hypothetical protein QXK06_04740 [Candidatus Diapherotrites archaeon]